MVCLIFSFEFYGQGTYFIYIRAAQKCGHGRTFWHGRSRAYDRDAWHCSLTWSSGVTASQATRMSNLDHDMLSIFLVAFRMRRKLAQVSLNQHGPGTSRSACAACGLAWLPARSASARCYALPHLHALPPLNVRRWPVSPALPRAPNTAPALPLAQSHTHH